MNPWTIIGWAIITVPVVLVLFLIIFGVYLKAWMLIQHLKTRSIRPAAGQVWMQNGSRLEITEVTDAGTVCMTTRLSMSRAHFSDSPEGWTERVRNRRLYLLKES